MQRLAVLRGRRAGVSRDARVSMVLVAASPLPPRSRGQRFNGATLSFSSQNYSRKIGREARLKTTYFVSSGTSLILNSTNQSINLPTNQRDAFPLMRRRTRPPNTADCTCQLERTRDQTSTPLHRHCNVTATAA